MHVSRTDSYWLWALWQVTYSLSFPTAKADTKGSPVEETCAQPEFGMQQLKDN